MGEIFISHSSVDLSAAMTVADALRQGGHTVFLDCDRQDDVVPGSEWTRTLFHNLRVSDAVVFLNSPQSQASKWCHTELSVAVDVGKRCYWLGLVAGLGPHPLLHSVKGIEVEGSLADATQVLLAILRRDGLANVASWDQRRPPYPGLAAMEVDDAGVFFGRDDDVMRLVERVSGPLGRIGGDLVVVVAPSGAGKSSLVRAGLSARLAVPTSGWAVATAFEPGPHPLDRLVNSLLSLGRGKVSEADCRDRLWRFGLGATAGWLIEQHQPHAKRLLVVVDQAEQLASVPETSDREEFLQVLAKGLETGSVVTIVMTARSDRFDEVQRLPLIGAAIQQPIVVAPMDVRQLGEVIKGPAMRADIEFEPGLVGDLVDDAMHGRTGDAVDSLPLLAFVLREMYNLAVKDFRRVITSVDYDRVGRIEGAIARRAAAAESSLPPASRAVLGRLLPRFVTLSDERLPAGRPVARQQLSPSEEAVVQALEDQRLLTGTSDTVRLAHEGLIVAWPALAHAVAESKEDLVLQARLERQAADWEQSGGGLLLGREAVKRAWEWLTQRADPAVAQGLVGEYVRRSKKTLSRRRVVAISLGLIVVLALVAGSLAGLALRDNAKLSTQATKLSALATKLSAQTRSLKAEASIVASDDVAAEATSLMSENLTVGMLLSLESFRLAADATSRAAVLSAVNQPIHAILEGDGSPVDSVAFSHNGQALASETGDGKVVIWRLGGGNSPEPGLNDGSPTGGVGSVAFSPNDKTLASADNGDVDLWDTATRNPDGPPLDEKGPVTSVTFSRNGDVMASAEAGGKVELWDLATRKQLGPPLDAQSPVSSVAFNADGGTLATGSADGNVLMWDVPSRERLGPPLDDDSAVTSVAFSPTGDLLATGDEDGEVVLWDAKTDRQLGLGPAIGQLPVPLNDGGGAVTSVAFSPNGDIVASGDQAGDVVLWQVVGTSSGTPEQLGPPLSDGGGAVTSVAFSPNSGIVASGDAAGTTVLWNARNGLGPVLNDVGPILTDGSQNPISDIAFSPNGGILAGGDQNSVVLWDVAKGPHVSHLFDVGGPPDYNFAYSVDFSPDGKTLAAGDEDGDVLLWNAGTYRLLASAGTEEPGRQQDGDALPPTPPVYGVAFGPGSETLAIVNGLGDVELWDLVTKRRTILLSGAGGLSKIAFSPRGNFVATSLSDGDVLLWNVATGKLFRQPLQTGHVIDSLAFSPDGRTLATGLDNGYVLLWNTATGTRRAPLIDGSQVNSVAFSPDGNTLAAGDENGDVSFWNVATGNELGSPLNDGSASPVTSVAFSPSGGTLATADAGDIMLVPSVYWDGNFEQLSNILCPEVRANLTEAQWKLYVPNQRYQAICPGYS